MNNYQMSWRDWSDKISEICELKHGDKLSTIEIQYDASTAYDQGKTPEMVVAEMEKILESWTNQGLNIYGMKGGSSPRHPETKNSIIYRDWLSSLNQLVSSELLEGISTESFWLQGYSIQELKTKLEMNKK